MNRCGPSRNERFQTWTGPKSGIGPANYVAPEVSFASYPSTWLTDDDRLQAPPDAAESVSTFLQMPLTNLVANRRCHDRDTLVDMLKAAEPGMTIQELVGVLEQSGVGPVKARCDNCLAREIRTAPYAMTLARRLLVCFARCMSCMRRGVGSLAMNGPTAKAARMSRDQQFMPRVGARFHRPPACESV